MIQKLTIWKTEYCKKEWVEYVIKKWDTLTKICKEYYGDSNVAYDLMEMYGISEDIKEWKFLFLPKKIWEYTIKSDYYIQGIEQSNEAIQIFHTRTWTS
jgi:hypothetical protein